MIINNNTQVVEVSLEARGVTKVADLVKGSKVMDAIVIIVVSLGMYKLIVTSRKTLRMRKYSKITMHL